MDEETHKDAAEASASAMASDRVKIDAAMNLCLAIGECDRAVAVQIMAAAMESLQAGMPASDPFWQEGVRSDAEWWADLATPHELEAYTAAGLRAIERTAFCERARKRLFLALWGSMTVADRQAFIGRVDPAGKFRGKA